MEMLTKYENHEYVLSSKDVKIEEVIKKLGYFEHLYSKKRLALLPCKEGTPVYVIENERVPDDSYNLSYHIETNIVEKPFMIEYLYEVGKTVFLNKNEAKHVLQQQKNKKSRG